ncbi:lipid transferase CIDEB isoform X2 [Ictidomys tridecemlineatus]
MEYFSSLNPNGLLRAVSSMSSELGRRVWTSAPPPQRPFRVCDHKRTIRKGLTAATRQELLDKALKTLLLHGALTLVLEEDGTSVESEDFFQMLEDDTCLMVLELGQSWSPTRGAPSLDLLTAARPGPCAPGNFLHPSPCSGGNRAVAEAGSSPLLRRDSALLLPDLFDETMLKRLRQHQVLGPMDSVTWTTHLLSPLSSTPIS